MNYDAEEILKNELKELPDHKVELYELYRLYRPI